MAHSVSSLSAPGPLPSAPTVLCMPGSCWRDKTCRNDGWDKAALPVCGKEIMVGFLGFQLVPAAAPPSRESAGAPVLSSGLAEGASPAQPGFLKEEITYISEQNCRSPLITCN